MKIFHLILALLAMILGGELFAATGSLPIMQGTTNETSTWVVFVTPADFQGNAVLKNEDGALIQVAKQQSLTSPDNKDMVFKTFFQGLSLGKTYTFEIRDQNGTVLDSRTLKTFAVSNAKPRIAFLSCIDHRNSDKRREFWRGLASYKPQAVVMGGDNVYIHEPKAEENPITEQDFWRVIMISWRSVEYYRLPELIPTFGTWDDHDYAMNNGDETYVAKDIAKKLFQMFYGTEELAGFSEKSYGVGSLVSFGGMDLFLMDNRYYRTPNDAKGPNETQWGKEQEDWLIKKLTQNKRPALIVSGSQYFGAYLIKESYEKNHPTSFKNMMKRIGETGTPVAFVSGDRHFTEFMKIEKEILGYETFEITASGMQTDSLPVSPWLIYRNPRQIDGVATKNSYVMADLTIEPTRLSADASAIVPDNKLEFKHTLRIKR